MLTLVRRYLSLCALLFWQGGFAFYAVVVVPAAGAVLAFDLHLRARITDQVVSWLNWTGAASLALLLWELTASADPSSQRRWVRRGCWAMMVAALAVLFGLHSLLQLLDPPAGSGPKDADTFVAAHTAYLGVSAAQWLAAMIYLGLTPAAWRGEDARLSPGKGLREAMRPEEM
jgi:hypothetical protein